MQSQLSRNTRCSARSLSFKTVLSAKLYYVVQLMRHSGYTGSRQPSSHKRIDTLLLLLLLLVLLQTMRQLSDQETFTKYTGQISSNLLQMECNENSYARHTIKFSRKWKQNISFFPLLKFRYMMSTVNCIFITKLVIPTYFVCVFNTINTINHVVSNEQIWIWIFVGKIW